RLRLQPRQFSSFVLTPVFGFSNRVRDPSSSASAGAFPPLAFQRYSQPTRTAWARVGLSPACCAVPWPGIEISRHDKSKVRAFMTETKTVLKPTEGEYPCRKWRTGS